MDITELSEHPEAIDEMGREELLEAESPLKEAISGYANSSKDHDRTAEDRKADLEAAIENVDAAAVKQALSFWLDDPDLAGLRDPAALDQLPDGERQQWQSFWQSVRDAAG